MKLYIALAINIIALTIDHPKFNELLIWYGQLKHINFIELKTYFLFYDLFQVFCAHMMLH